MNSTILNDFLTALRVKHTAEYTNQQFSLMPFQSLFGMKKLLEQYGVPSDGYNLSDKDEVSLLDAPFIAQVSNELVIVTEINDRGVTYESQGASETVPLDEFKRAMTGMVFVAFPSASSIEPEYASHHLVEVAGRLKHIALKAGALLLFLYLFISNGIYAHWATVALTIVDLAGLWLCYSLVQKSLGITTRAADHVCGVLQEGGCDHVLSLKASTFLGFVKWSEVGLAYYIVSTLCLLVFPQYIGYLALINVCCLPFTVWSIWYQKFRAKAWCTLCVSVQLSLWLQFFCYLFGGAFSHAFPIGLTFFMLCLTYLVVLLAIDAVSPLIDKTPKTYDDNDYTHTA